MVTFPKVTILNEAELVEIWPATVRLPVVSLTLILVNPKLFTLASVETCQFASVDPGM